ncbi:response regulator [Pseudorhizobium endolithicum]|uniref:histidine kinase n=1 Tax=Pseudorhizobium endolithicum TaxID=1191678 RepID=A0ABM8PWB8_9HYPH|nr:ATP-binding protein [Pseudorhizobium endolithicum]CAD7052012.1 response regulator [Pseudorhizobium endolithicum]
MSRQMAAVVHELRTPLNGILGMTYLLGQTKLTAEQQNYLSGIRQSGHALAQLVEDLLDLSTLEAGKFRLNARVANLRQLIESVVEMLAPRAHEKRIEIAATVAADVPELLEFDPARLRQVLFNVIGNAVKFTGQGGVLIRVHVEEPDVVIAVSDTGPGMTAEAQKRLFQDFEQMGDAAQRSGGTGLGLAIACRILREFGGSLSAISESGVGSSFTIRFPLRLAEDAAAGAGQRNRLLVGSRVLLLAPAGPAATAMAATIETLGGFCRRAGSAEEAAEALAHNARNAGRFTDLIVDHRMAAEALAGLEQAAPYRILLVNPEERASQPQDLYDAWLIRPLREKSLIDVLVGRLRRRDGAAVVPVENRTEDRAARSLAVLVAEDDPVSAMLVSAVLRKAGHRVTLAEDAAALLERATSSVDRQDLIVSDLHMPGMDVVEALSAVRRHEKTTGLHSRPIIVLSGDAAENSPDGLESLAISAKLTKPADPAHLLRIIDSLAVATFPAANRIDVPASAPLLS